MRTRCIPSCSFALRRRFRRGTEGRRRPRGHHARRAHLDVRATPRARTPRKARSSRLWAKALAIESAPGRRIVIVTTDVVGIPRAVTDEVAARVEKQYGLKRSQFFVNASHTHTGPVVWPNLNNLTVFPPDEQEKLIAYQPDVHR